MRETVVMYRSLRDATKELPKEIRAEVYDAVMDYAFDGVEPELAGVAKAMFLMIKPLIDKNNQRYENGCKGGRPKSNQKETETKPKNNQKETKVEPNDNDNDNDNDNVNDNVNEKEIVKEKVAKAPTFKKPTLEEVKAYCQERNNGVDAEKWMDHYTANGWKVGKNPMRDWKATVRTWEKLEFRKPVESKTSEPIKLMDFIDQMERREAMA